MINAPATIPCRTNPVVRLGAGKAYTFSTPETLLRPKKREKVNAEGMVYVLRPMAMQWELVPLEVAVKEGLAHQEKGGKCIGAAHVLALINNLVRGRAS